MERGGAAAPGTACQDCTFVNEHYVARCAACDRPLWNLASVTKPPSKPPRVPVNARASQFAFPGGVPLRAAILDNSSGFFSIVLRDAEWHDEDRTEKIALKLLVGSPSSAKDFDNEARVRDGRAAPRRTA